MAHTIAQIVARFKSDIAQAISPATIEEVCQSVGHVWRDRILTPVVTLHAFLLQILHGNMAGSGVARLIGKAFSAAAYCEARMRLPLELFARLLQHVGSALTSHDDDGRWRGHRIYLLDGSSFSMPDTPELQRHFGQPGAQRKGCGFPIAHWLCLFHAGLGFVQRVLASPLRTHDMAHVTDMHPEMQEGDILAGDRAFASFVHLALLSQRKLHGVFRSHQKQIVDFRPGRKHTRQRKPQKGQPRSRWLKRLGHWDQLVEYTKPKAKPKWMSADDYAALPSTLVVRELRYRIAQKGCRTRVVTLVTTLLDPVAYPARELADLYERRWQAEVNLRHLKTTMGMEVLHSKTVEGVTKELYAFALVYNLVRLVMLQAARQQQVPVERISFIDALRCLRHTQPGTPLAPLIVNPKRKYRFEPRVRKRRPKSYPLMTKPRAKLRKALERQRHAA
jgi:hypothetical protein